jgi:hypothetical protein
VQVLEASRDATRDGGATSLRLWRASPAPEGGGDEIAR